MMTNDELMELVDEKDKSIADLISICEQKDAMIERAFERNDKLIKYCNDLMRDIEKALNLANTYKALYEQLKETES